MIIHIYVTFPAAHFYSLGSQEARLPYFREVTCPQLPSQRLVSPHRKFCPQSGCDEGRCFLPTGDGTRPFPVTCVSPGLSCPWHLVKVVGIMACARSFLTTAWNLMAVLLFFDVAWGSDQPPGFSEAGWRYLMGHCMTYKWCVWGCHLHHLKVFGPQT